MIDFLAMQVLEALKKAGVAQSWIDDKKHDFEGFDRLKVLRSFSNLDQKNLTAVCEQIGVSMQDMQATLRVLRKI